MTFYDSEKVEGEFGGSAGFVEIEKLIYNCDSLKVVFSVIFGGNEMISFEKNAKPRYYERFIDKAIIISALIESDEDLFVYVPEIQAEIIPSHVVKEQYGISEKPLSEYIGRYRQREITNLLDRYKKEKSQ